MPPEPSNDQRSQPDDDFDSNQVAFKKRSSSNKDAQDKSWMKVAGLGMELAGSTLLLGAAGHLVDRYNGNLDGTGIAIGAFLGFSLGMVRFIQKALQQIQ